MRQWLAAAACCRSVAFPSHGRRSGFDRRPCWDGQGRTGRRPPGAVVRVTSAALIVRPSTTTTNEKGQLRFPALPPGAYCSTSSCTGFATYHEEDIRIGAGATIERTAVLKWRASRNRSSSREPARASKREAAGSRRVRAEDLKAIPTRRFSMFDFIRAAPGVSPTSPASGTVNTVSAFGSGTNENLFLIDGTNFTCPCSGVARAEPGVDFIQEVQVQSVGASAEFGNMQGAVFNVVTRQGSDRFLYDASYYGQTAGLTSQPVLLPYPAPAADKRLRARQVPRLHDEPRRSCRARSALVLRRIPVSARLRQSAGHRPGVPEDLRAEQVFAKLTWRLAPGLQLVQSFHDEFWVNPELPTFVKPFEATQRRHASVPAMTFGHLTHTLSANTVWDVRVGRFVYSPRGRPQHRRSDDAEPVRPRDGRLQRRAADSSAD